MIAPDGWYTIIAYEAGPAGTWGTARSWTPYTYSYARPITGPEAQANAAAAALEHASTSPLGGAVRGYWWDGATWQRRPELRHDWGQLGVSGAQLDALPTPRLQSPSMAQTTQAKADKADKVELRPRGARLALFVTELSLVGMAIGAAGGAVAGGEGRRLEGAAIAGGISALAWAGIGVAAGYSGQ